MNVGDDLEFLGLRVSPDLDSVLYALAGVADEQRGWGRAGETWNALDTVSRLGEPDWFKLGDRDLGLHVVRTNALRCGRAALVVHAARRARVRRRRDDPARRPTTSCGRSWSRPRGRSRSRSGSSRADIATTSTAWTCAAKRGLRRACSTLSRAADMLLIGPSNPYVSVGPILAVPEIRAAIEARRVPCVAVSPLVGGRAVKGPADRMLARLAGGTTPAHVASVYAGLIDALVVDEDDDVSELDVQPIVTRTLMQDEESRRRVAEAALSVPV